MTRPIPSVLALRHGTTIPLHTIRLLWRKDFYSSLWCLAHVGHDSSQIATVDVGMSRIPGSINSKSFCGGVLLLYFYHSLLDAIPTPHWPDDSHSTILLVNDVHQRHSVRPGAYSRRAADDENRDDVISAETSIFPTTRSPFLPPFALAFGGCRKCFRRGAAGGAWASQTAMEPCIGRLTSQKWMLTERSWIRWEKHRHLCPPVGPLSADHARDCPTPPAQKGAAAGDGWMHVCER